MDPIDLLRLEHQQMERMLEALDVCAGRVEDGDDACLKDLVSFAQVFEGVDGPRHHFKEERLLIPLMVEHGVPADEGLLAAVRSEHEEERELADELIAAAKSGDAQRAVEAAFAYSDHARCHIFTEDTILFPKARTHVLERALEPLVARFKQVDQELETSAEYSRLRATRDELVGRYGTNPACIQPRVSWQGTEE